MVENPNQQTNEEMEEKIAALEAALQQQLDGRNASMNEKQLVSKQSVSLIRISDNIVILPHRCWNPTLSLAEKTKS